MKYLLSSAGIAVIISLALIFAYHSFITPKVAFVRSSILIEEYDATKEARMLYQQQLQEVEANIDTLKKDYDQAYNDLQQQLPSLNEEQKSLAIRRLQLKEENLMKYSQQVEAKMQEEENRLLEGVFKQVNAYAEQYGKANGYTIILSTTASGNILFAEDAIDITDDLLEALNKEYHGE